MYLEWCNVGLFASYVFIFLKIIKVHSWYSSCENSFPDNGGVILYRMHMLRFVYPADLAVGAWVIPIFRLQ